MLILQLVFFLLIAVPGLQIHCVSSGCMSRKGVGDRDGNGDSGTKHRGSFFLYSTVRVRADWGLLLRQDDFKEEKKTYGVKDARRGISDRLFSLVTEYLCRTLSVTASPPSSSTTQRTLGAPLLLRVLIGFCSTRCPISSITYPVFCSRYCSHCSCGWASRITSAELPPSRW